MTKGKGTYPTARRILAAWDRMEADGTFDELFPEQVATMSKERAERRALEIRRSEVRLKAKQRL